MQNEFMNGALKYWRKQKMWDNFNEIFPTGKVEIDGETIRTSIENEI